MCLVVGTLLATKADGILDLVADGLAVGVLVLGAAEFVSGLLSAGLLAVGLNGAGGLSIIRKAPESDSSRSETHLVGSVGDTLADLVGGALGALGGGLLLELVRDCTQLGLIQFSEDEMELTILAAGFRHDEVVCLVGW